MHVARVIKGSRTEFPGEVSYLRMRGDPIKTLIWPCPTVDFPYYDPMVRAAPLLCKLIG